MLVTIVIYIRVGIVVFQKRAQIKNLSGRRQYLNRGNAKPFSGMKTTEVQISSINGQCEGSRGNSVSNNSPRPGTATRGDEYSITISSSNPNEQGQPKGSQPMRVTDGNFNLGALDSVTWAFTKCAALFAASLLITWIPSSANRLYPLFVVGRVSFPLNVASAVVLPLQGFWNAIIYFTTSRAACKVAWSSRPSIPSNDPHLWMGSIGSKGQGTESTVELSTEMNYFRAVSGTK
jgi:hypothetical protein